MRIYRTSLNRTFLKQFLVALVGLLLLPQAVAQMAIGTWRDCPDFSAAHSVALGGGQVYAASNAGVFCYDADYQSLSQLTRTTGLSDVGIGTIAYDPSSATLAIAYNNANVDLVQGGKVYNLSDIKRSTVSSDLYIHSIRFHNGRAYFCCGFGVVVVDLQRREVQETYYLGTGGSSAAVYDMAFLSDTIFAATAEGLKCISSSAQLGVSDRWHYYGSRPNVHYSHLATLGSTLLAVADAGVDTLVAFQGGVARTVGVGNINSLHASTTAVVVAYTDSIVVLDASLRTSYRLTDLYCHDAAMAADGTVWAVDPWNGLLQLGPWGVAASYYPAGPLNADNAFRMRPFGNRVLISAGGHDTHYESTWLPPRIAVSAGRSWRNLGLATGTFADLHDVVDAVVNPYDTSEVVAAAWHCGVLSIRGGQPHTLYDGSNTSGALVPYTSGDYTSLRPSALTFDPSGNLWVLTAISPHALARRSPSGVWTGFSTTSLGSMLYVDKLVYDTIRNLLWFSGNANYLYVHDGVSRMVRINPNYGSKLTTESVNTFVQDHEGNIWIGTNKGIKVIYNTYHIFDRGGNAEEAAVECNNITISNGEFAEYLMAYENITDIAVDGANRKWVGTATGGLYLISANGMEQLQHFTTANSPLFSNRIVSLAIQPQSGEVYVGTDQGLQVYRSDATYATAQPADSIYAFPNPVRPDYEGPIAIKGVSANALVRITDAAGHTVFSTTAQGGQAIWHGRTQSGERVEAGIYYVFASDTQGSNRSVAKILVMR